MSTPVVIGDYAYMHLKNQRFTCLNLKTGEEAWRSTGYGKYASLVANGDKILALDERGELLLIKADPTKFELLDTLQISDDPSWSRGLSTTLRLDSPAPRGDAIQTRDPSPG
jgi:outer membrane protein assembly factor BamB